MRILARLAQLEREGKPVVLALVIQAKGSVPRHVGTKMLIFPDGSSEGTIGGGAMESLVIKEAQDALSDGKPRLLHYNFSDPERGDPGVCGGEMDIYVEPIRRKATLLVFGMGHVGKAVVHLGKWLGFRIVAIDDREEFAEPTSYPNVDQVVHSDLMTIPDEVEIDNQTYIVLTTREVPIDVAGLPALLKTEAAFIGVIGSRRRWETTSKALQEKGVSSEEIARVHSPVGLEIHAETPEEIALSILSEIIMIRRGGTGEKMAHTPVALKERDNE